MTTTTTRSRLHRRPTRPARGAGAPDRGRSCSSPLRPKRSNTGSAAREEGLPLLFCSPTSSPSSSSWCRRPSPTFTRRWRWQRPQWSGGGPRQLGRQWPKTIRPPGKETMRTTAMPPTRTFPLSPPCRTRRRCPLRIASFYRSPRTEDGCADVEPDCEWWTVYAAAGAVVTVVEPADPSTTAPPTA
jgi:hypothetical protein